MAFNSPKNYRKKQINQVVWSIAIVLGCLASFSPNPLETFVSCLIFPVLFSLLWEPGELPILLFATYFQTFQIVTPVFNANLSGLTLQERFYGPELRTAFYFSVLSIILLTIGIKIGLGKKKYLILSDWNSDYSQLDPFRLGVAYIAFFILAIFLANFAFANSSITQIILPITSLKWFIIFLIGWSGLRQSKFRNLMISVILVETLVGFTGFFSGFKTVFFLILVLASGKITKLKEIFRPSYLIFFVLILALTIYWQAVKVSYRNYVNLGSSTQTVQVSLVDRLNFHIQNVQEFSIDDFNNGFNSGLTRLEYLDFFAYSIRNVPSNIPHQNGKLWFEAIRHILTPRFLFPNKPPINDSDRTNKFTGLTVADAEQGTSISIGYMGESYIDFGFPLMLIPIFCLGYFWGKLYKILNESSDYRLLSMATGTMLILTQAIYVESSNLKIVGSGVSAGIMYYLILKFLDKDLWRWLTRKSTI